MYDQYGEEGVKQHEAGGQPGAGGGGGFPGGFPGGGFPGGFGGGGQQFTFQFGGPSGSRGGRGGGPRDPFDIFAQMFGDDAGRRRRCAAVADVPARAARASNSASSPRRTSTPRTRR